MPWFKVRGVRGIGILLLTAEDAMDAKNKIERILGNKGFHLSSIEEVYVAMIPIPSILDDLKKRGYSVR